MPELVLNPSQTVTMVGLGLIILLGAFLRFYQLGAAGVGNSYYAATVKSMLTRGTISSSLLSSQVAR